MTDEWPRTLCDDALAQPASGSIVVAPSGERRTGATRSALRRRDLRLLLLSAATSKVGDFLFLVALTAYVFEHTHSAAWVSAAVLSRFGVNAATFAVSSMLVLAIRSRSKPRPAGHDGRALGELSEGCRAFLAERTAVVLVGCLVAGTTVYGVDLVVLVLVSDQLLGTGTGGLGWLLAASGAGGVAGALLSPRIVGLARARRALALLVLMTGVPLASLSVIRLPVLAYAVMVVEGIAIVALDVLVETALQRSLTPAVLGRVSGLSLSLTSVGSAIGTVVAPPLVRGIGLPAALVVSGLVPAGIAILGLMRLSSFDSVLGRGRHALAVRVWVLHRLRLLEGAGPVELERVAVACTEVRVPAGTVVLRQGDPPDDLFVLVDGVLGVDHEDGGRVRRIGEMAAPDYLGEIGLVAGVPRTVTVVALTGATLWRVPGELFLDVVTGRQRPSGVLAGGMSIRLARSAAPGA